jgi:hypothetical protein
MAVVEKMVLNDDFAVIVDVAMIVMMQEDLFHLLSYVEHIVFWVILMEMNDGSKFLVTQLHYLEMMVMVPIVEKLLPLFH